MALSTPLRLLRERLREAADDPLDLLRLVAGGLLLGATLLAGLLAASGVEPRALQLMLLLWAAYGIVISVVSGVLEPLVDGAARLLSDTGLERRQGFSAIETLVARGHPEAAAEAYAERARDPRCRVDATLRRAALLAGPLGVPEAAAAELAALRDSAGLPARDDIRLGLALADLYEHRLGEPGRAMAELRRLIDRHPGSRRARQLRRTLAALKRERFGDSRLPS